jgi:hypothetical protein
MESGKLFLGQSSENCCIAQFFTVFTLWGLVAFYEKLMLLGGVVDGSARWFIFRGGKIMLLRLTVFCVALVLVCETAARTAESGPPDAARVEFYNNLLPETAHGVGEPSSNRKAWEELAKNNASVGEIIKQAEAAMATPMPELTDELYLDYSRTGKRDACQAVMFVRRGRLRTLTLAECFENNGRFLPAIEEAIRSYCEEKSWMYPAHDIGLRVFKGQAMDVDLGSSDFAWQLATAKYWLGDKLSPEIRKLVAGELERRIFTPFTSAVNEGKPTFHSLNARGNHNAVDLAGIAGSAMAEIESRGRRAFFAAAAEKYIEAYLSGFTPDGYCSEGVGYWNYGFGHYLMLVETIKQATGGKVDWLSQERIKPLALYSRRLEILPGLYPAFADCDVNPLPDPGIMAYLNRRYDWGLEDSPHSSVDRTAGEDLDRRLFEIGLYAFPNSLAGVSSPKKTAAWNLRDWFSDAGVLICRPRAADRHALGAALKGGHNAEQHNHNDIGSFVVALNKSTPIVDPGPENYTSRTFGPHRYDSNVLNSFGHSVPRVADKLQVPGAKAHAKILKTEFTDAADTLAMDISSAYAVKSLTKLERTFIFSREGAGKLTVTDEVEFSEAEPFGTALITLAKWKQLGPNRLQLGEGADAVQVELIVEGGEIRIDPQEIKEDTPDHSVPIRLGLEMTKPVKKAMITTVITPAK